jgi:UDP-glucose 4-epimerase
MNQTSPREQSSGKIPKLEGKRILVTGGAGFIGSHLVDRLTIANDVVIVDNLSAGKLEFIQHHLDKDDITFIQGDILDEELMLMALDGVDIVFHLAANPDVRLGVTNTYIHVEQNVLATYHVLEAMRKKGVKQIAFTSTCTVYGQATILPTPEDYGPMIPISIYGASKMSCEALISAYCDNFEMQATTFRFANVVGSRSTHGVTFDFVHKLKKEPKHLEILGDGKQTKSYFYISDCINAMVHSFEHNEDMYGIFNIGSNDYIDVTTIADAVTEAMGLKDVEYTYTGGVDGGRGWKGDVKTMLLSLDKLKELGWIPEFSSKKSIEMTAKDVLRDFF